MPGPSGVEPDASTARTGRHATEPVVARARLLPGRLGDVIVGVIAVAVAVTLLVSLTRSPAAPSSNADGPQQSGATTSASPDATAPSPSAADALPATGADPSGSGSPAAPSARPVPPAYPPSGRVLQLAAFRAMGDGRTDDTRAVQRALDALRPGDELQVPAGKTYRHTKVLRVHTLGARITGGGTFLATAQASSSFLVDADRVTVDGSLTFRLASSTKRWETYDQMKLRLGAHTGIVISGVTVDGSAAAGIYVGAATHFLLVDVTVRNTRADGIHITEGSSYGVVTGATVSNTGDDGIAVVSYLGSRLAHDIAVTSPRFSGQTWGRAFSVVGGTRVTWKDIFATGSSAAAVYIAAEPGYRTWGSSHVTVTGGTIELANRTTSVQHGAVLIYNGETGQTNTDITVQGLTIRSTRASSPADVRILSDSSRCVQRRILITGITVVGGPRKGFSNNAGSGAYRLSAFTKNGVAVASHRGW